MKSKIKKVLIPIGSVLVLAFIVVYIMSISGYYESIESKNNTLTKDAIERFEKDVLNGEKIVASNYLKEQPKYDNLLSRISLKVGNLIEYIFNKIMNSILKEVENAMK